MFLFYLQITMVYSVNWISESLLRIILFKKQNLDAVDVSNLTTLRRKAEINSEVT